MSDFASLHVGDPAPWFRQRCTTPQGQYSFDMVAGRYVLMFLFRSGADPRTEAALNAVRRHRALFDGQHLTFFGVSADAGDEMRLQPEQPGIRFLWDGDGLVGRLYGSRGLSASAPADTGLWYLIDPMLRVRGVYQDVPGLADKLLSAVEQLPPLDDPDLPIPALMLPDVFEPEFSQRLIRYYEASSSVPSGIYTEDPTGTSRAVLDNSFKRRRDCVLRDRALVQQVQARIIRRVVPEIRKVFQFEATQLDRLILASYDASDRGCFGPHRDNTVKATEHRRFAVSINLNQEFEGGELMFPEFGRRTFRPPAGGAIVFSCGLMHAVTPVTAGRRLACLPFVYDDAAAKLKQANKKDVADAAGTNTAA
ncbi:2OG-Fe(II) oxygenase [Rhizosaccharibacter radicis]|uniref:2OG-Fe(II) oxygenase n=1 Tax=Rhizosaccharibacter radicis TaxID=2782605 RepID=A0ABT1VSR0_9PROT|nr:2OG-Fe(II) oxygenase [Acetobacteraceae bacterium KSS12]